MKKHVRAGFTRTIAHTAIVSSGDVIENGAKAAMANGDYAANADGEYDIAGVKSFPKLTGLVIGQGVAVDYEIATKSVVATTTGDFALGELDEPAVNGNLTVNVLMNGLPMAFV